MDDGVSVNIGHVEAVFGPDGAGGIRVQYAVLLHNKQFSGPMGRGEVDLTGEDSKELQEALAVLHSTAERLLHTRLGLQEERYPLDDNELEDEEL